MLELARDYDLEQAEAVALWAPIDIWEVQSDGYTIMVEERTHTEKKLTGTTQFFRHPEIYNAALNAAAEYHDETQQNVTILDAGSSIGATAYSVSYEAHMRGYGDWLRIQMLDVSPIFTAIAAQGIYKTDVAVAVLDECPDMLERYGHSFVRVRDIFRQNVHALAPQSFLNLDDTARGDVTMTANALIYMNGFAEKMSAVTALSDRTRYAFVSREPQSEFMSDAFDKIHGSAIHEVWQRQRGWKPGLKR